MLEVFFGEIQHGHMEQVGYDTYCKLLDEVVKEIQGVEVIEEKDVQIDLNISSYIPDEYIENGSQKIEIYQKIALCRTENDIQNIIDEMIDRFGSIPEEANSLIEVSRIKELCKNVGITKIVHKNQNIVFYMDSKLFPIDILDTIMKKYKNKIKFSPSANPYITYKLDIISDGEIIKQIKQFLGGIYLKCKL